MFLARKIKRRKWKAAKGLAIGEIPADTVTSDLRTQANVLSFWQCPSESDEDVEAVVLAIATARDHFEELDVVWLDYEELQADGQTLQNTKGFTPIKDMVDMHVDVSRLDYLRLGKVAERIAASLEMGRFRTISKARVKALIQGAIEQDRVNLDGVNAKLRARL